VHLRDRSNGLFEQRRRAEGTSSVGLVGSMSCPGEGDASVCPSQPGIEPGWVGCTQSTVDAGQVTSCSCVDGDAGAAWACTTASLPPVVESECQKLGGECLIGPQACAKPGPVNSCGGEFTPADPQCCLVRY
jgi:hypothetical protein